MIELALAAIAVAIMVGLALWRPELAVMVLGVYLFIQSALIRIPSLPEELTMALERADEIVLAALVVRTLWQWLIARQAPLPTPLWALVAFGAIGVVSALVNGVGLVGAGLGIFLAVKAGLWLFVGRYLRVDVDILVRYATFIGALFVGVVAIAALQVLGVPMPWETTPRAGVFAATSIWNQHTAFGGALSVAIGLAVVAFRLPGERASAVILAVAGAAGILLSTARRLLASLVVAAVATLFVLPRGQRPPFRAWLSALRRPVVLVAVLVTLAATAIVVGPRLVSVATYTWEKYVVELGNRDRYRLYVGAYRLVEDSPIVGRGPATYGSYASVVVDSPAYEEAGFRRRNPAMVVGGQIASLFAEYGIFGFLAFATFLGLLVRALLPISRGAGGTLQAALATGGIFMVVNMVVESVVNPVFSSSFVTFFTFTGIGAAMTLHAASERDPSTGTWQADRLGVGWRLRALAAALLLLATLVALVAIAVPR